YRSVSLHPGIEPTDGGPGSGRIRRNKCQECKSYVARVTAQDGPLSRSRHADSQAKRGVRERLDNGDVAVRGHDNAYRAADEVLLTIMRACNDRHIDADAVGCALVDDDAGADGVQADAQDFGLHL